MAAMHISRWISYLIYSLYTDRNKTWSGWLLAQADLPAFVSPTYIADLLSMQRQALQVDM